MATELEPVVTEVRKYKKEYQLTDESGQPIGPPQVFEAETPEELADKLANAHIHASRALHRTRQQYKPDLETLKPSPTSQWTADEAWQLHQGLQSPEKAAKALDEFIEKKLKPVREDAQVAAANAVSQSFIDAHEDYVTCAENQKAIMAFLGFDVNGQPIPGKPQYAWTLKNLNSAYDVLRDQLTLKASKPQAVKVETPVSSEITEPKKEEITSTPAVRPRGTTSTGLMSRHGSGSADVPRKTQDELFAEEVNKMTRDQLKNKIEHDPKFRERLNNLGKK